MKNPDIPETLIRVGSMVTMDAQRRVLPRGGIVVRGEIIKAILSQEELAGLRDFQGESVDASRLTALPGFVQTHLHLCQTMFRGLADDLGLLEWLKLKIFPLEAAHDARSMRASALLGLAELIRSGTTTIMDMGSIHHEEEIVRAIEECGVRAFVGKALMDINEACPSFRESAGDAIASAEEQMEAWHRSSGGRIQYAVAPRFVLSCSDGLLRAAQEMVLSHPGVLLHTHAAEHPSELEAVRKRCGMGNIAYFRHLRLLAPTTCLAHCVWVDDGERELLREHSVKVLHCPTSNLKLGSGVADVPAMLAQGIAVSLGADGAPCNNTLDMFQEMKLAALIQKPSHGPRAMDAATVLEMATMGGAKALGLGDSVGSLEAGKKADIVLLDLGRAWNPSATPEGPYSSIVYSSGPENVHSVMVNGSWLYRGREYQTLDEAAAVQQAAAELQRLLGRVAS